MALKFSKDASSESVPLSEITHKALICRFKYSLKPKGFMNLIRFLSSLNFKSSNLFLVLGCVEIIIGILYYSLIASIEFNRSNKLSVSTFSSL